VFSRRLLTAYALALFVATSSAISTSAQTRTNPAPKSSNVNLSAIRIDNFGRINEGYYRGAQPDGRDYADLAALGVKTVIDLQADGDNQHEEQLVRAAGMTFYRIPMTTRVEPTSEQLALFRKLVNDSAHQPVYVHCAGGRHRTGVMTAVYRMENDGWTAEQAFREMKKYDFGMDFLHPEFKKFVYAYQVPEEPSSPILATTIATPPAASAEVGK
jgi:uncharacterized protein (TIGR01244 family)